MLSRIILFPVYQEMYLKKASGYTAVCELILKTFWSKLVILSSPLGSFIMGGPQCAGFGFHLYSHMHLFA